MTTTSRAIRKAFAQSGWRNFGPLVGPSNVAAQDYFGTMGGQSRLWSYGCGGGYYSSSNGVGNTANFASTPIKTVFTLLFGSYFRRLRHTRQLSARPIGLPGER
ncbi:MAG: hypothetical protein IPH53_21330 [Flavobacteriales bacterium]|nr:hypothetical protein [Flavobacteriales bacterium]